MELHGSHVRIHTATLLLSLAAPLASAIACQVAVVGDEVLDDDQALSLRSGYPCGASGDASGGSSGGVSCDYDPSCGDGDSGGSGASGECSGGGWYDPDEDPHADEDGLPWIGSGDCSSDFDCEPVECNRCYRRYDYMADGFEPRGYCRPIDGCAGQAVCSNGELVDFCEGGQSCCPRCPGGAQCTDECGGCDGTRATACDGAVSRDCAEGVIGGYCVQYGPGAFSRCIDPGLDPGVYP